MLRPLSQKVHQPAYQARNNVTALIKLNGGLSSESILKSRKRRLKITNITQQTNKQTNNKQTITNYYKKTPNSLERIKSDLPLKEKGHLLDCIPIIDLGREIPVLRRFSTLTL